MTDSHRGWVRVARATCLSGAVSLGVGACQRDCLGSHGGEGDLGGLGVGAGLPLNAVDCPDGLARCEHGSVLASRIATIAQPCAGPVEKCSCPWESLGSCAFGCVADMAEVVIEASRAKTQLCAASPDAGPSAIALTPPVASSGPCEEGQRYGCRDAIVTDCLARIGVGRCVLGCVNEGASIDQDDVSREAAFALLCSR